MCEMTIASETLVTETYRPHVGEIEVVYDDAVDVWLIFDGRSTRCLSLVLRDLLYGWW